MMLYRAAQMAVLTDVEIMKGQADAYATIMTPTLHMMTEARKEQDAAAQRAGQRLGSEAAIAAQVLARPELRGHWSSLRALLRHLHPLGVVGAQWSGSAVAAPVIARWTASVSLGSLMTVATLFALARTITLGV